MRNRPKICVAIDRDAPNKAMINVGYYKCPQTGRRLAVNHTLAPFSPFSGRNLKQIAKQIVPLPVKEIRTDLVPAGICSTCEGQHYMYASDARALNNKRIHCTICNSKFRVRADDAALAERMAAENDKRPPAQFPEHDSDDRAQRDFGDEDNSSDEDNSFADPDAEQQQPEENPKRRQQAQENSKRRQNPQDNPDGNRDNNRNRRAERGEPDRQRQNNKQPALAAADDNDDNNNDDENEDFAADNDDNNDDFATGNDNNNNNDDASIQETPTPAPGITPAPDAPLAQPTGENAPVTDNATGDDDNNNDDNNDDDENEDEDIGTSEIVSAKARRVKVNAFARAGGLTGKSVHFVQVHPRLGLILADDQPVIKLDADKAGENEKLFADGDDLSRAVQAIIDAEENPQPEHFAKLGGEAIEYDVPVADAIKQRINDGVEAVTAAYREQRDNLNDEMRACISIAALIVHKGMDKDLSNPLRDAFVGALTKVNVRNPENLVDAVFAEASEPYIKTVLAKANDLLAKPLEARNEIARFAERATYQASASSDNNEHAEKFARASVPLSTAADATPPVNNPPPARHLPATAAAAQTPSVRHFRELLRR